ncbi:ABC transporter substrate-binding protein [Maridesulfovibrio sp. FT414]|uniref:ABC transporter substrate-binding protein n=1 Tax=Maridesulfovibrio sp. FT414 TaxID=2979469 RepID=UPI003D8047DD
MRNSRSNCFARMLFMTALSAILFLSTASDSFAKTITFWTTEVSADRQAVIGYLVSAFRIYHPEIEIIVKGVEENRIAEELGKAIQEGDAPDVVGCASDLVVAFGSKGWMNSLQTRRLIDSIGQDKFYAGALSRLRLANRYFCGIPFNGWVQGIWYRKDWFAEKGLAAPNSWRNILAAAKAFHHPEKGRYGILIGTRADAYAEQVFTHLALSAGVEEFSKDGRVVFDSPATVKTLEFYKELSRYTPPGPQWWRGRDFYLQGRLAMMFYSTFIMDDLAAPSIAADSLGPDNFPELDGADYDYNLLMNTGVVTRIKGSRKAGYGVIHALGLIKTGDSGREEAAARFVEFLFRDDAYITWLHMVPGGMLPVLKHVTDVPMFYRDVQGGFSKYSRRRVREIVSGFDVLKSFSFTEGVLIPQAAIASAQGIIPSMIDQALRQNVPAAQAVSNASNRLSEIVSE